MTEFFFETWPNGAGPAMIQLALVLTGAFVGVRAIDDVKAWITARAKTRQEISDRF